MRWIKRIAVVTVVGLLLAGLGGYMLLNMLAAQALERGGSYAMGVPTHLSAVNVRPLRGEIAIQRLRVDNPDGYQREHFVALDDAEAVVELRSLMNRQIVLPRLHLNGLQIELEYDTAGRPNYDHVLEHLGRITQRADGRRYRIDELILTDVTVALANPLPFGPRDALALQLDEIRLTNVGSDTDGGVLLSQVYSLLVRTVLEAVAAEAGRTLPTASATWFERFALQLVVSRPGGDAGARADEAATNEATAHDADVQAELGSTFETIWGLRGLFGGWEASPAPSVAEDEGR